MSDESDRPDDETPEGQPLADNGEGTLGPIERSWLGEPPTLSVEPNIREQEARIGVDTVTSLYLRDVVACLRVMSRERYELLLVQLGLVHPTWTQLYSITGTLFGDFVTWLRGRSRGATAAEIAQILSQLGGSLAQEWEQSLARKIANRAHRSGNSGR